MMLKRWRLMTPHFKIKNVQPLQTDLCTQTTRLTVNVTFDRSITKTTAGAAALTGHVIHVPPVREAKRDKQDKKQMWNDFIHEQLYLQLYVSYVLFYFYFVVLK